MRTFRQRFGDFKKSTIGHEVTKYLYHKQLGLCPINKCSISLNDKTHLSHIIPLSFCEEIGRYDLCIDDRNLFLELGTSNIKRKNKIVTELIEDALLEIDLSQEELHILMSKYMKKVDLPLLAPYTLIEAHQSSQTE
jgi:hypothetical protein